MFRPSDPQKSLFDASGLLPPEKRKRCEQTWAEAFRRNALPILRRVEGDFSDLFDPETGRPNRPVELVVGVLILKEMNDLTDQEALDALEWNALWWWAFQREPGDLHLCQKTLHNFRSALIRGEMAKLAFRRVTDELIRALGMRVDKQRLDSTHILSNFAVLTRLGLFCETTRVFLRAVKEARPRAYEGLPAGVLRRHGEEAAYADARRGDGPRRLAVVARDVGRLIERFKGDSVVRAIEEWKLLERLFKDQCTTDPKPAPPAPDDDDRDDGVSTAALKNPKDVKSDSLQTPHDPDVTYSGHKGKGYSMQIAETCAEGDPVRVITEVEVTPACKSDAKATVPTVDALVAAGIAPRELAADTGYSGASNAAKLSLRGVNLTAPAPAMGKPDPEQKYPPPAHKCPIDARRAGEWLRCQEAAPDFRTRYAIRAGIESTNSEMKRVQGLGKLRVRGGPRVRLAAYFKALACNVKRALRYWTEMQAPVEGAVPLG